ncbi:hypothetical protein AK830_g12046 [Neonectria ditissima]|uniref:Uncharacterized protein n=1 Tax=Neonectria ditissima TaxID=78410 RepID=A0A0P7B1G8_9HYPO|nr:hypothetical protein AK830_g12046 [Neonectria ditissima]
MMDTEKAPEIQRNQRVSCFQKLKAYLTPKKLLVGFITTVCILAVMFGIGLVSAQYVDSQTHSDGEVVMMEQTGHRMPHGLLRRHDHHDGGHDDGVPIPISTQTALTTLYSISHVPEVATETATVTGTTYITVIGQPKTSTVVSLATIESSSEVCSMEVVTMTQSITITIIPTLSSPGDATVTGNPSTLTEVRTDISISSELPDATVSGNPGTFTDVQTDWSVSSGLPDATVSGNPDTVTNVQTEFSISSGLPDATVSGNPSTVTEVQNSYSLTSASIFTVITITDLWPAESSVHTLRTVTEVATVQKTITVQESALVVVTVSEVYHEPSTSTFTFTSTSISTLEGVTSEAAGEAITAVSPTSTFTKFVTKTSGEPLFSTTTVRVSQPPYPTANNTIANDPSGTVTSVPNPTTPVVVVISGGSKKPEPRGWGGNGTSNLGCAIMLIATIMFML